MKTDLTPVINDQQGHSQMADSPLARLLACSAETGMLLNTNSRHASINGLLLGVLQEFASDGIPQVYLTQFGLVKKSVGSLVQLTQQDIGRQLVLGFENGSIDNPIILGLMYQSSETSSTEPYIRSTQPLHIEQNGERTVIAATEELELRCGEAVIVLRADGHIQLRGEYITSHASAGQRIRGGSVQIN